MKDTLKTKPLIVLITLLLGMIYFSALADDAHTTTTNEAHTTTQEAHNDSDGHHGEETTMSDHHSDDADGHHANEDSMSDHHANETTMSDHHGAGTETNDHHAKDSDNHHADTESNDESHSDCEMMMAEHHGEHSEDSEHGDNTDSDHHASDTKDDDHHGSDYTNDHYDEADCEAVMVDHHSGEGLLTEYVADVQFALRSEIIDAETMAYVGLSETILDIRNPDLSVQESNIVEITLSNTTVDEHDMVIEFMDKKIHSEHVVFGEDVTTFAFEADKAGHYYYYCTVEGHREAGMEGVFHVNGKVRKIGN